MNKCVFPTIIIHVNITNQSPNQTSAHFMCNSNFSVIFLMLLTFCYVLFNSIQALEYIAKSTISQLLVIDVL